jgi:hypothetical protein
MNTRAHRGTAPLAAVLLATLTGAACTSSAQHPAAPGSAAPTTAGVGAPAPSSSASPAVGGIDPAAIALPAGLSVTWTYTPSENRAQDDAVRTVQAFERAVDAGVATANPHLVDFTALAGGSALAWEQQVFASYAHYHETWTGTVVYDRITAPTITAAQVVVQYCQNERAFYNKRADGTVLQTTPSPNDYYLITASLLPAPGDRWLINTRSAQDGAASCQPDA